MIVKKNSLDWSSKLKIIVLDPDGWDRMDYVFSFEQELITEEEFRRRLLSSTLLDVKDVV